MLISVADFAEERKQDRDTVNAYIRNHPEIQKETVKRGKSRYLDTESAAFKALERKYPLEKPVEVIEDTEARRQLIDAQQMIIKLQQQLVAAAPKIALAEQNQQLLEAALEEKANLQEEVHKMQEEKQQLYERVHELYINNLEIEREKRYWQELKADYERKIDLTINAYNSTKEKLEAKEKQLEKEKEKTWWDKLLGR